VRFPEIKYTFGILTARTKRVTFPRLWVKAAPEEPSSQAAQVTKGDAVRGQQTTLESKAERVDIVA